MADIILFGGGGPVFLSVSEWTSMWKPEINFRYCSSGVGVSHWPGVQKFCKHRWQWAREVICLHPTIRITNATLDFLCGCWGLRLKSLCLYTKLFTDWAISPAPVCSFVHKVLQDRPRCSSALYILMGIGGFLAGGHMPVAGVMLGHPQLCFYRGLQS